MTSHSLSRCRELQPCRGRRRQGQLRRRLRQESRVREERRLRRVRQRLDARMRFLQHHQNHVSLTRILAAAWTCSTKPRRSVITAVIYGMGDKIAGKKTFLQIALE